MIEETMDRIEQIADLMDVGEQAVKALYLNQYLNVLWPEVASLPSAQRRALLLHLEQEAILAFVYHGCCSVGQLAEALELRLEEFADWFGQLPLPDERIAAQQNLTRQQVINQRKCARERLSRRLKLWAEA